MGDDFKVKRHILYRFYDQAGSLLYVGITRNPPARFRDHARDKDWWLDVVDIKLEHYSSRTGLRQAEQAAIIVEHPRYNVVHNQKRGRKAHGSPGLFEPQYGNGYKYSQSQAQQFKDCCSQCMSEHGDLSSHVPIGLDVNRRAKSVTAEFRCTRNHRWQTSFSMCWPTLSKMMGA